MLTRDEIHELKESEQYKDAFATALQIHRTEHEPGAAHFRNCEECKSGFALLLCENLEDLKKCRS